MRKAGEVLKARRCQTYVMCERDHAAAAKGQIELPSLPQRCRHIDSASQLGGRFSGETRRQGRV
jgi:hypothetical protein